jgi:23S rRNA (guanosine2251-2'-O)-methyltransferase
MENRQFNKGSDRNFGQNSSDKDVIFGIRPVIEAIKAGKEIEKLLVQKDQHSMLIQEMLQLARELKVPISMVPVEKLNTITRKNHQGVICFISPISYSSIDHVITQCFQKGKVPMVLILDRITDVRNFGAIARTAEFTGVDAIVIPSRGSAQISSDAIKTSAGALHFIPVCREENLKNTIAYLKESGLQIVGCTEKATKTLSAFDFKVPVAILMGSEEDGISPEYLRRCDDEVKIPMKGQIHSLNVSVAAGMILYEAVRQRE